MKTDMFGQEVNLGDYVCCTSSSASTGMYIGKIEKLSDHKVSIVDTRGNKHLKSYNKIFIVTHQIENIPELMI